MNRELQEDIAKFQHLSFDKFRELANQSNLEEYEKIGFPAAYRKGYEAAIFSDIRGKLRNLSKQRQNVLDIGPGCSALSKLLIDLSGSNNNTHILVDSKEMLSQLPNEGFIVKIAACFPDDFENLFGDYVNGIDVVIAYSVLHYVFNEGNLYKFIDCALSLLATGGELLIGDIPNVSKRKRFFKSETGINFHKEFMDTEDDPTVVFNSIEHGNIDDSVVLSIISRCRAGGFDAYIAPQDDDLPLSNRREDVVIRRP